jgi:hypothetical protein
MALVLSKSNEQHQRIRAKLIGASLTCCSGGMDDADIRRYFDAHKNRLPSVSLTRLIGDDDPLVVTGMARGWTDSSPFTAALMTPFSFRTVNEPSKKTSSAGMVHYRLTAVLIERRRLWCAGSGSDYQMLVQFSPCHRASYIRRLLFILG